MKTKIGIMSAIIAAVFTVDFAYSENNLDRVPAVESLAYFVESRFPQAPLPREDSLGGYSGKAVIDIDLAIISETVGAFIDSDKLDAGRLWIEESLYQAVRKWDGFGGRISQDRIIVYDDISRLIADFDPKEDIAIMDTNDLEKVALKEGDGLEDAVILSFNNARLEYMDQIVMSLVLIRELRHMLRDSEREAVLTSDAFYVLRSMIISLMPAWRGFPDEDIIDIVPQQGVPFARRALTILQHTLRPIQREDLERIRRIQSRFRGV